MNEKTYEVKTYEVTLQCDNCNIGIGEMKYTNKRISNGHSFEAEHKCNNCGYIKMIRDKTYPYITHNRINNTEG